MRFVEAGGIGMFFFSIEEVHPAGFALSRSAKMGKDFS